MKIPHWLVLLVLLGNGGQSGLRLQAEGEQDQPEPTIAERASRLPKVLPKSPQESLAEIELHEEFEAVLVAAEPLIKDPVAIDFDESSRMFVVELPPYNGYAVEGFQTKGSIRMLEDTDADGLFDKSTLYAEGLNYPTALACWNGGVFVGDAPDLLYLKDTNGDGRSDERRVVFTGFGSDKAGEAHLNSIRWGFDNRFHLSTNLSGGDVRVAGVPQEQAISVRGRGFVFDPRNLERFALTSGAGQHGMSMDDWGRKFVCQNSVPAQTLMYDDRYIGRNPYLVAPPVALDIVPDGKFTKLFRVSGVEPWRQLRTELRKNGKFQGSDEGGKPFGFFTGATGVTIYRGDAWPEEYRGNLLVGDVANNLIHRARIETNGLQLTAMRVDHGREFLASRDIWFRPVQFANAPDGTLYVLDIYRGLIEGAAFLPPEFLEFVDPVSGNDRGRIYRLQPRGFAVTGLPRLGDLATVELVPLLDHRNGWHRDTASRLIYRRQDTAAIAPLLELATAGELAEGRMSALYSLAGLRALHESVIAQALRDRSSMVRVHALRLSEGMLVDSAQLVNQLCNMTDDKEVAVRYQLAFSLGAVNGVQRNEALAKLVMRDAANDWMQMAVLSSLQRGAAEVFQQLVENRPFCDSERGRKFLLALAKQVGSANRTDEIAVILRFLSLADAEQKQLAEALVATLAEQLQGEDRERMLTASGGTAGRLLEVLLQEALQTARDLSQPLAARTQAIRGLRLSGWEDVQDAFQDLFDLQQPLEVQMAVVESLAEYNEAAVADLLLNAWGGLSPQLRRRALETLLSRVTWIDRLLDDVEEGVLPRADLDPARVELLKGHPVEAIAQRVRKLFSTAVLSDRARVLEDYQVALDLVGDAAQGKVIFKKVCATCHRLEGVGVAVGADLRGIRNRGMAAVMLNILDPNRTVKPRFQSYVLATDDGRIMTGMIESENANSLTIRQSDGKQMTLLRNEVEELRSTGVSFMPTGLEKQIKPPEMADLLAYLESLL